MDSLRISLLVIGVLVIAGIYLLDVFKQHRKPMIRADFPGEDPSEQDSLPELKVSTGSLSDNHEDFSSTVTDLGSLLTKSRNEISRHADEEDVFQYSLNISVAEAEAKTKANDSAAGATDQQETEEENADEDEAKVAEQDRAPATGSEKELIVLYITAAKHNIFNGLSISRAAQEAGLVYGHMNIFHHFGLGKMRSSQPLFSMANMFEPGFFDLGKISELKTNGIVLFMYSPATIDGQVVFELFLNSVRRIAEALGGEIRNSHKDPLTNTDIETLRERVRSHSKD